jgi:hypothetical protein
MATTRNLQKARGARKKNTTGKILRTPQLEVHRHLSSRRYTKKIGLGNNDSVLRE